MENQIKGGVLHWPHFWALVGGFCIQMAFGIFATMLTVFSLLAADESHIAIAFPAPSFGTFVAGAVVAAVRCEFMCGFTSNVNRSYVLWGCFFATPPLFEGG